MVNYTTQRRWLRHGVITQNMIAHAVCTSVWTHSLGGRPKKQFKPGRPVRGSFQSAIQHIKLIASSTFCKQEAVIPSVTPSQGCFDCTCPICLQIIDKPIELKTCKRLVCADCLCQWLQVSQTTSCPCCYTAHLNDLDRHNALSFRDHFDSLRKHWGHRSCYESDEEIYHNDIIFTRESRCSESESEWSIDAGEWSPISNCSDSVA